MIKKLAKVLFVGLFVVAAGFCYSYFRDGKPSYNSLQASIAGGIGAMIGVAIAEAIYKKPPATQS